MNDVKRLEQNTKNSFHFVKEDIRMLEEEHKTTLMRFAQLERAYARILTLLRERGITAPFVGNRQTKELHQRNCILAQGSTPEQLIAFPSPQTARRQGFQECVCLHS